MRRCLSSDIRALLVLSAAHFAAAMGTAFIGFGWDMDRLRSRTLWSRAGASMNDVLMYPHDAFMRAVPNGWIIRNLWVIPLALVVSSLLWGTGMYLVLTVLRRRQRE